MLFHEIHKRNLQNLWVHAQLVWANVWENTHYFYAREIKTGHRETITLAFKKLSAWPGICNISLQLGTAHCRYGTAFSRRTYIGPALSCWPKSKTQTPDIFAVSFLLLVVPRAKGKWRVTLRNGSQHREMTLPFLESFSFPELVHLPEAKSIYLPMGPKRC